MAQQWSGELLLPQVSKLLKQQNLRCSQPHFSLPDSYLLPFGFFYRANSHQFLDERKLLEISFHFKPTFVAFSVTYAIAVDGAMLEASP